jgi:type IV pilus assembly protein PilQ
MVKKMVTKFPRVGVFIVIGFSILPLNSTTFPQPIISLDFRDADIRNVLRLIAEVAELNIVIEDEVKGRITLRLVDVPWDRALEVILRSRSLGTVRVGNVIRIASSEKLRKEGEAQLASKRAKEKMEDLRTEIIHLNYAVAKEMIPIVKIFLSGRGAVVADERTNRLVVRDIPENIEAMKNLFR